METDSLCPATSHSLNVFQRFRKFGELCVDSLQPISGQRLEHHPDCVTSRILPFQPPSPTPPPTQYACVACQVQMAPSYRQKAGQCGNATRNDSLRRKVCYISRYPCKKCLDIAGQILPKLFMTVIQHWQAITGMSI
ncbi:hypothetical protein BaRGS_00019146 [Batillaria attramentaria]|uniref:Uncharacterized protein n=1 Tax=Batillaria attramentaria TaxID=370345 RepID=A0ABD0KRK2_9CAEN